MDNNQCARERNVASIFLIFRAQFFERRITLNHKCRFFPRGGGGGGEGTQQSFILEGSAPRSKPLPFNIPFLIEKVPLSYTFNRKWYPFIYLRSNFYHTFHLRNPLKYLDESAVRCVSSTYFEKPF